MNTTSADVLTFTEEAVLRLTAQVEDMAIQMTHVMRAVEAQGKLIEYLIGKQQEQESRHV